MSLLNAFSQGGEPINLASDFERQRPFGVYVGVAGDVKFDPVDGSTMTVAAQAGAVLPWAMRKIYSTANGTTASALVSVKI